MSFERGLLHHTYLGLRRITTGPEVRRRRTVKYIVCIVMAFAILCAAAGCGSTEVAGTPQPTSTPTPTSTPALLQLQPGVYATNDVGALPLASSGYQIYIVGEPHGQQEVAELFLSYLASLHTNLGLRDVIMEEDQVYEQDANDFVLGVTDTLRVDLCLRTNILTAIRALNRQARTVRPRLSLSRMAAPAFAFIISCKTTSARTSRSTNTNPKRIAEPSIIRTPARRSLI